MKVNPHTGDEVSEQERDGTLLRNRLICLQNPEKRKQMSDDD